MRFDDFTFDTSTHELLRGQERVHLSPKAFQLLALLIDRRPAVVVRRALEEALWPDTYVSFSSLNRVVAEVRKALGEGPSEERFIRTVHRVGYAFVAATEPGSPGDGADAGNARVWLVTRQREVELAQGTHLIGRGAECTVRFDQGGVSRRHARLIVGNGRVEIEDLASRNGTFVNGRRIEERATLADGDEIGMGTVVARLRTEGPDPTTELWTAPPRGQS